MSRSANISPRPRARATSRGPAPHPDATALAPAPHPDATSLAPAPHAAAPAPPPAPDASAPAPDASTRVRTQKLVIAVHDLAGYTRAAQTTDDVALATFMDAYYALCSALVRGGGGRVVKFIGDACLAVFPADRAVEAVDAIAALRARLPDLACTHGLPVGPGAANVHLAVVAEGEFGPSDDRRYDVLGAGVNHTFLLGQRQGPGLHVSEPVYRALPNDRRTPWRKQRPPAVYTLPDPHA